MGFSVYRPSSLWFPFCAQDLNFGHQPNSSQCVNSIYSFTTSANVKTRTYLPAPANIRNLIVLYQAVLIFVADLIMLVAPIPILCGLQMPTRKIVALLAIFGSGIIACIAPLVRFSALGYLRAGSTDLTCTCRTLTGLGDHTSGYAVLTQSSRCTIVTLLDGDRIQLRHGCWFALIAAAAPLFSAGSLDPLTTLDINNPPKAGRTSFIFLGGRREPQGGEQQYCRTLATRVRSAWSTRNKSTFDQGVISARTTCNRKF
jgi:hypothetical protein